MFGKRETAEQRQNGTRNSVSMEQSRAPSQEPQQSVDRDQPTQPVANAQPATNENPVKAEPLRKPVAKERLQEVKVGIFNDLIEAVDLAGNSDLCQWYVNVIDTKGSIFVQSFSGNTKNVQ